MSLSSIRFLLTLSMNEPGINFTILTRKGHKSPAFVCYIGSLMTNQELVVGFAGFSHVILRPRVWDAPSSAFRHNYLDRLAAQLLGVPFLNGSGKLVRCRGGTERPRYPL